MRVAGFALGGGAEQRCHIVLAFNVGLVCEVQVTTVRLRLAGKGVLQVLLGLGTLQCCHGVLLVWGCVRDPNRNRIRCAAEAMQSINPCHSQGQPRRRPQRRPSRRSASSCRRPLRVGQAFEHGEVVGCAAPSRTPAPRSGPRHRGSTGCGAKTLRSPVCANDGIGRPGRLRAAGKKAGEARATVAGVMRRSSLQEGRHAGSAPGRTGQRSPGRPVASCAGRSSPKLLPAAGLQHRHQMPARRMAGDGDAPAVAAELASMWRQTQASACAHLQRDGVDRHCRAQGVVRHHHVHAIWPQTMVQRRSDRPCPAHANSRHG